MRLDADFDIGRRFILNPRVFGRFSIKTVSGHKYNKRVRLCPPCYRIIGLESLVELLCKDDSEYQVE